MMHIARKLQVIKTDEGADTFQSTQAWLCKGRIRREQATHEASEAFLARYDQSDQG